MSKTDYENSKISDLNKFMFSSKLCEEVIQCSNTSSSTYNKSMTISFEYLVYLFKQKFSILLPEDKYVLTADSISAWIAENKVVNFILWLDEIMTMARAINIQMDSFFIEDEKSLQIKLLICALVLIPVNIALIIFAEIKFLQFLHKMLVES